MTYEVKAVECLERAEQSLAGKQTNEAAVHALIAITYALLAQHKPGRIG